MQILAAAIAGGLIAYLGTRAAFGLNALTFLVSALLVAQLQIPTHTGQLSEQTKRGLASFVADARAGLSFARHDPLPSIHHQVVI